MYVNSVIIEKIEYDGTLKTVQLNSAVAGQLIVSFPNEYDEKRSGPFYFHNRQHDRILRKTARTNGARKLNSNHLRTSDLVTQLSLPWRNIPTEQGELSYYALSLPNYAVPFQIAVINPHNDRPLKKAVIKDEQKKCYVVYIECRSRFKSFGFDLECSYKKATYEEFKNHEYYDDDLIPDVYAHYDAWQAITSDEERERINIYMEGNTVEIYNVNQAAAVGRNVVANNNQLTQTNQIQQDTDSEQFMESLAMLREELMKQAKSPEQILEIAKVAEAELAVKDGDVSKAKKIIKTIGGWAYDIAVKLGVALVVEQFK